MSWYFYGYLVYRNVCIWQNNNWQQLNFDLSSVGSVDRVVFLFDPGMVNWDTYYIDDIGLSAAAVSIDEIITGD